MVKVWYIMCMCLPMDSISPNLILGGLNPFVAVGWFINHYFFVKFFFLEEKIIPKIFQTFGWCIYPVSVTLWAPWLGDFDNLNLFYRKIKIEKMPKFETLLATNGLTWQREQLNRISDKEMSTFEVKWLGWTQVLVMAQNVLKNCSRRAEDFALKIEVWSVLCKNVIVKCYLCVWREEDKVPSRRKVPFHWWRKMLKGKVMDKV